MHRRQVEGLFAPCLFLEPRDARLPAVASLFLLSALVLTSLSSMMSLWELNCLLPVTGGHTLPESLLSGI